MSTPKHFLTLSDLTSDELRGIISRAQALKALQREGIPHPRYPGKVLAMLFAKASTRTRVSFEVGMRQLGGALSFSPPLTRSWGVENRLKIPRESCHQWSIW